MARWQKVQKFNFPLPETNDLFDQLKCYFLFIKETYVHCNNIDEHEQELDIVKLILDKNFNMLGEKHKSKILRQFKSETNLKRKQGKVCGHTLDIDNEDDLQFMNES